MFDDATPAEAKKFVKECLVIEVTKTQGCKLTELITRDCVVKLTNRPTELINELIDEGKLVEIEYVLPELEFRVKSYLLPSGTKVLQVKNESDG